MKAGRRGCAARLLPVKALSCWASVSQNLQQRPILIVYARSICGQTLKNDKCILQGKEADVVIFSCVRARAPGAASSIGFLADVRRMNVALTRARCSLLLWLKAIENQLDQPRRTVNMSLNLHIGLSQKQNQTMSSRFMYLSKERLGCIAQCTCILIHLRGYELQERLVGGGTQ